MNRVCFNPSTRESGRQISKCEASLVYRVGSKTARATQRNTVLKSSNGGSSQNGKVLTEKQQVSPPSS